MPPLFFLCKSLWQGKTIVRALLDYRLLDEMLQGKVLDLGSGGSDQYTKFIPREKNVDLLNFDQKIGNNIDFEKDALPFENQSFDQILFMNVLEHIFNHEHILKEIKRIKKQTGCLIGFVPFLKWYHQDPHDYFRYTHEALDKLFIKTGYRTNKIEVLYIGPYSTAFDMILPTIPIILRPLLYVVCYACDSLYRSFRKERAKKYALGYFFTVN